MKKIVLPFLMGIIFLSLPACNLKQKLIGRLWFYTHSNNENIFNDSLLTPVSFVNLYPDGTYTRDFGAFESGSWRIDGGKLKMASSTNKIAVFEFKISGSSDLQLQSGNSAVINNFESQPAYFASESDDPFSVKNNQWRIPPVSEETEAEIRLRLVNHCHFWEMYFTWALKYEFKYLDVRSTPTLIKIYGNGFALKRPEDLPARWRSCFYDEQDCEKASQMMKAIFDRGNISWGHTDNKFKMFLSAFQQIEQQLISKTK